MGERDSETEYRNVKHNVYLCRSIHKCMEEVVLFECHSRTLGLWIAVLPFFFSYNGFLCQDHVKCTDVTALSSPKNK